jgi:hypothetical protein
MPYGDTWTPTIVSQSAGASDSCDGGPLLKYAAAYHRGTRVPIPISVQTSSTSLRLVKSIQVGAFSKADWPVEEPHTYDHVSWKPSQGVSRSDFEASLPIAGLKAACDP